MMAILKEYYRNLQVYEITYILFFQHFGISSLFARNQSLTWFSSFFAVSKRVLTLLSEQNRFVSSAKSTGSSTLVELLRSFTKIRKSKGSSIKPWEKTHLTIFISVLKLSNEKNCFLFEKYLLNHSGFSD